MHFQFQIHQRIGEAHNEEGFLHVGLDGHTDGTGHSLVTGTIGVTEVERRLRDALRITCEAIACEVEKAVEGGARIE